jgi:uncharacterized protein (TIGR03067 family)
MKFRLVLVSVAVLLAAVSTAAPVPKEFSKKRTDADVFVGAWETVVALDAGKPTGKATWTFDTDLKMNSTPLGGTKPDSEWVIKLEPNKSPKEIDITHYKGIYEFDGADIKIAFSTVGRPTDFDAKPGVYFNLLRRIPDGKK